MRLACTSACLLLLTAAAPSAIRAQPPANNSARARAIVLFEQSRAAFEAGRFREAARLSREAHDLSPHGDLLYNHARALDLAKDIAGALAGYRELVARYPGHAKQRFAEQRIEELAMLQQQATPAPAAPSPSPDPAPAPPPAIPDAPSSVSPWPWVVTGVGLGGVIAGFAIGGVSAARHGEAVDEPRALRATELQSEAEELERAAIITLAASGAVAAAGLVWGIVDVTAADSGIALDTHGLRLRF